MGEDSRKQDALCGAEEVASFTECTGLTPALPLNEAEDAAVKALYAVHAAKRPKKTFPK